MLTKTRTAKQAAIKPPRDFRLEADDRRRAQRADTRLAHARELFREALPMALKRRLTIEIADDRAAELQRAYPDLVSVTAGFRQRRSDGGRSQVIAEEPCVVFIVARKRARGRLRKDAVLPVELLCHVEHAGDRRLCAVPTDVAVVLPPHRTRVQASTQRITVGKGLSGPPIVEGVAACCVLHPDAPSHAYLIGCRHVFSHDDWASPPVGRNAVRLTGGGPDPVAETSLMLAGRLSPDGISCDVHMARISDTDGARAALAGPAFTGAVMHRAEIPTTLYILTPEGPIAVQYALAQNSGAVTLRYNQPGGGYADITHGELIECKFATDKKTVSGHSGSPLATAPEGGLLVGMHIAVGDNGNAFAIPAWVLLATDSYDPDIKSDFWTLIAPNAIPGLPALPAAADFTTRFTAQFQTGTSRTREQGFAALIDCWAIEGDGDKAKLAYILASCWHETGYRMEPVRETFADSDAQAIQALDKANPDRPPAKRYWQPVGGRSYFGRGLIQLTHLRNYEKLGNELDLPLVAQPELALDLATSARIAVIGMRDGLFSNKRLADYFSPGSQDWIGARAIVNGKDQAKKIAGYAQKFLACL